MMTPKTSSVHLISINNLTSIPSVRFVVRYFLSRFPEVRIMQPEIQGKNSYFEGLDELQEFPKRGQYPLSVKIQRYRKTILKIILLLRKEKSGAVLYTPDFQIVFITLFLRKFFRSANLRLVYHQFELIESQGLGRVGRLMFRSVNRNASLEISEEKSIIFQSL